MTGTGMSAAVGIRPARLADAAGIAGVHVETWQAAYAGIIRDRYLVGLDIGLQTQSWQREIQSSQAKREVLVAEFNGPRGSEIVGFGSCGRRRSVALPYAAEVYTLYVALDWQGQGLGRRLLGGMFRRLVRAGCNSAFLWVLSENPSRFFYEAQAGRPVAQRQESFDGGLLDETAYAWPDLEGWLTAQTQASDRTRGTS